MPDTKIIGYKKLFGLILPDWVSERMMRMMISGLLSSLVMLLVLILVVKPRYDELADLRATLARETANLNALTNSRNGILSLENDLTEDQQQKILSAVPVDYSPDRAIFLLRKMASDTGASIVSYSLPSGVLLDSSTVETIGKRGEMVEFNSYPIKIIISAPVDVLLRFISKVESSLPFGVVADLNLQEVTKLSKGGVNKNVQISLEIKYYQAKLNKIDINAIKSLNEKNLEFAEKLADFDVVNIEESPKNSSISGLVSTSSGDIFGL